MEDVSEIMTIANRLATYTNDLEKALTARTKKLEIKLALFEKKIAGFTKNTPTK